MYVHQCLETVSWKGWRTEELVEVPQMAENLVEEPQMSEKLVKLSMD
jgi:hypothetical protein